MRGYQRNRNRPFPDATPVRVKLKKRPSFVQLHGTLTSIIGALIVLTTFIVKDSLREDLKDKIGNLQASVAQFEGTAGRIITASETDAAFEAWQGYFKSKLQSPEIEFERKGPLELRKEEFDAEVDKADTTYRSSGKLLKQLDGLENVRKDYDALGKRLFSIRVRTSMKVSDAIVQNVDQMSKAEAQAALTNARKTLYSAGIQITILSSSVFSEGESIVDKAGDEQRALETKYKRITILSYFLYVLGWCLTLLGRVFRVDGLAADSD